jgi:hypothetical protein
MWESGETQKNWFQHLRNLPDVKHYPGTSTHITIYATGYVTSASQETVPTKDKHDPEFCRKPILIVNTIQYRKRRIDTHCTPRKA